MAEKRRDSKGRLLRNGEVQRPDGKYMYRYTDVEGNRQTIYSWRLVETDKLPSGARDCAALRTMVSEIERDLRDGIKTRKAAECTLNDLFDLFMELRTDLKETTRCNYLCLYNTHVRDNIGCRNINKVKYTDIQKFYLSLSKERGLRISTLRAVNSIVWQSLQIAVHDDALRRNPADGVMNDVGKKLGEEQAHRSALTVEQQHRFIDYIKKSNRYCRYASLFTILLGTGMRIGECLGLRWSDVDFKQNAIHVSRTLIYKNTESGGYTYRIGKPKTASGYREIPMFSEVRSAFQREKRRKKPDTDLFVVDGLSGFIFLNSHGKVYTPAFIFDTIQNIVTDYNSEEAEKAWEEKREPCLIPKISAHILRHTFCTRLCELEKNAKVVQEVMGHKNIRTTMDVYNEASSDVKHKSFEAVDGAIYLG